MSSELKSKIRSRWVIQGADTIPKMIEQTFLMCNKYQKKMCKFGSLVESEAGVVCIQQGEAAGNKNPKQNIPSVK